jgi:probable phosphoglycerate mutase
MSKQNKIILVRHGQTDWNAPERFRGRVDILLNEIGLVQAEATGKRIVDTWHPTAVYASPLNRAVQTAEKIARLLGLTVQPYKGLIDIDYGEWQGLSPEEVSASYPEMILAWRQAPNNVRIPGGETLDEVQDRAMAAVLELCSQHLGETIVLVSHTVVNRLILLGVLGAGGAYFWSLRQEPCAINIIEAEDNELMLVSMNDTCHLTGIP